MTIFYLLLLVLACVCFGVAAFARNQPRVNLVALGLLLFALVPTIQMLVRLD
jgi:hypothetical protein